MKTILKAAAAASALAVGLAAQGCGHSNPPPATPAIADINGGLAGSGTVGSLFVIDGSNLGSIAAATTGYSVDFRDATSSAVVAPATVNFGGSGWTSVFITGTVPAGLTVASTYKVTVTTPGGTSNAVNFLIASGTAFSPSSISWSKAAANLTAAAQGSSAVVAAGKTTSYIYVLGGNTGTVAGGATAKNANTASVSFNTLDSVTGGTLSTWTPTTALPAERGFAAAVLANSFNSRVGGNGTIYLLGGLDKTGAATGTVYVASMNADGTIPAGAWAATTALPQALFAHDAVIFHGRVYVVGGNDSTGSPVSTVYSAAINSDGTLGAWATSPSSLPVKLAYHHLVTTAGNLYVVGGTSTSGVDPVSNASSAGSQSVVYYSAVDLQTGALKTPAWTATSSMSKGREKFTATAAGTSFLVTGGLYAGSPGSSESTYATLNPADGSLSGFGGATGTNTFSSACGYNPYNHSSAFFVDAAGNPHILILGGADAASGALHAEVCYQH